MNLRSYTSLLFAFFILITIGCSDDDAPAPDTTAPVITITSPENNAVIDIPATVTIAGTIVEAGELQQVDVVVTGGLFPITYSYNKDENDFPPKTGDTYALTQTMEVPEGAEGSYTINIRATDVAGNVGTQSLNITLQ